MVNPAGNSTMAGSGSDRERSIRWITCVPSRGSSRVTDTFVCRSGEYQNSLVVTNGRSFPSTPGLTVIVSRVPITLRSSITLLPRSFAGQGAGAIRERAWRHRHERGHWAIAGDSALLRGKIAGSPRSGRGIEHHNLFGLWLLVAVHRNEAAAFPVDAPPAVACHGRVKVRGHDASILKIASPFDAVFGKERLSRRREDLDTGDVVGRFAIGSAQCLSGLLGGQLLKQHRGSG
jgi:hypothetical protein